MSTINSEPPTGAGALAGKAFRLWQSSAIAYLLLLVLIILAVGAVSEHSRRTIEIKRAYKMIDRNTALYSSTQSDLINAQYKSDDDIKQKIASYGMLLGGLTQYVSLLKDRIAHGRTVIEQRHNLGCVTITSIVIDAIIKEKLKKGEKPSTVALNNNAELAVPLLKDDTVVLAQPAPSVTCPDGGPATLFAGFSSGILLAILMICCCGVGSGLGAFRVESSDLLRPILLGMLFGFATFLALKGGRSLFLFEIGNDSVVTFNSYSAAFGALLVGLFTSQAFGLLEISVDRFVGKIEKIISDRDVGAKADGGSETKR